MSDGEAWTFETAFEQLEKCEFECEGGPLRNNVAYQWLKANVSIDPPLSDQVMREIWATEYAKPSAARGRRD